MAGQGIKTSFRPIALAIRAAVAAALGFPEDCVIFSRIDATPRWQNDDVVLRITGAKPYPGFFEGHGTIAAGLVRAVIVEIRSRLSVDISDRSEIWLLDTQIPREDAVILGVTSLRVPDSTPEIPNVLTIEEISIGSLSDYRDELARVPSPDSTWGSSYLVFEVAYNPTTPPLPGEEP